MAYDKTARVLNQLKPQPQIVQPIATDMVLPNKSGKYHNILGDNIKIYPTEDTGILIQNSGVGAGLIINNTNGINDNYINLRWSGNTQYPFIKWRDTTNKTVTGLVTHNQHPTLGDHRHFTIYTIDETDVAQGRFYVEYGRQDCDITAIKVGTFEINNVSYDDTPTRINRNYTDNAFEVNFENKVDDAGTYTLAGNVAKLRTYQTETSGTINNSVDVLNLTNDGKTGRGLFIDQNASGIALEIDSEAASNEGIKVAMSDATKTAISTTGLINIGGNLTFDTTARTVAGIQNQNLVDKTDTETISGAWTFGASGTGTTVIFNSDASGVNLTWDHDATAGNPLLAQTIENSRTSYWKISGTDTSPATMSEGILSIVPTFTTGTAATGANLLFFKPTDSRSISSGTNFTRGIRIEPNRSGTKTSTGSDDLYGISIVPTDGLTINASSGTTRRYGVQASAGSTITLSQGGQTYENRNFLADGSIALINSTGTNTSNIYGLEIADSYTEALIGGSITATKIGVYYHPTMNSAADVEYALLASRSGIGLLSDGATGTYTGGNLYLGAGKDAEIYYDGTDLCIGSALVGSGTINLTDHTASSITTETLSEYITIKVNGTSKKIAIVA